MKKLNWKNIMWIIIEIMISVSIYYLTLWTLDMLLPTNNSLFAGIFIGLISLGISYGVAIFGFIKIDELITGTKLNIGKGFLFFIKGLLISYIGISIIAGLKTIDSDWSFLLGLSIVMTISVIFMNYGLRRKKTMPNNV